MALEDAPGGRALAIEEKKTDEDAPERALAEEETVGDEDARALAEEETADGEVAGWDGPPPPRPPRPLPLCPPGCPSIAQPCFCEQGPPVAPGSVVNNINVNSDRNFSP